MVTVSEFIEHHGVKGMKWGQRHARKKAERKDRRWENKQLSGRSVWSIYNYAAININKDISSINEKYKGKNLATDPKLKEKYDREVIARFNKHVTTAASARGTNPSGTKKLHADINPLTGRFFLSTVDVAKHDNTNTQELKVDRDANGFIIKISLPDMMQSETLGAEFLEHHGVKGMKWGIRNKRRHQDGKHGSGAPHAKDLSDEELRRHIERMDLERRYSDLVKPKKDRSEAKDFVKQMGKNSANAAFNAVVTHQIAKVLKNK